MSQTILIETNEDLKKIFSLNLHTFVGTDVITRKDAEDALALLRILPQVSLVITKSKVGNELTAVKLLEHIRREALDTSLIVLGECPELASEVLCLQEPISWEILIKEAASHLGVTVQDTISKVKPDFLPVGTHYFHDVQSTPCDVYIRIRKGGHDDQYVKRIHAGEIFDRDLIGRYEAQGLREFYIPKDYVQHFTTFVTNNMVQRLEREDLSLEERILTTAHAHEIVRDSIVLLGLDDALVELSEASINSMIRSVKDSPEVSQLLTFLFSNKVSYAYQHCYLLALMGHYILLKQSWYKDEHLGALAFASFFSDVTLRSPKEMLVSTMKDLLAGDFTDEEKRQVLQHAQDAFNLLKNHPEAADPIKTILLQSHGRTDGVGLEENPGEELHPLSKVFIISDSFVKVLLNPSLPSTKRDILPLLAARFIHPSYQKIIKALELKFQ